MSSFSAALYLGLMDKAKCGVMVFRYADGAVSLAIQLPAGGGKARYRHWKAAQTLLRSHSRGDDLLVADCVRRGAVVDLPKVADA